MCTRGAQVVARAPSLLCTEVTGDPMTFSPRVYQEVMLYWPADPQSRLCHMGS